MPVPQLKRRVKKAVATRLLHFAVKRPVSPKKGTAPAALGCGWSGRRIEIRGAEGGTRTPMPFRAQRPERCVSTNFTTSAFSSVLEDVDYNIASQTGCQEVSR